MKIISSKDQKTIRWSGGTSAELYIFPENAEFSERNFDFRISTATIEVEKSEFTSLSGYFRKILVLEGTLDLHHENHHSCSLKPFEQDSFSGDWKTISVGKATDFNVIFRPELHPEMEVVRCEASNSIQFNSNQRTFFYLVEGTLRFNETEIAPRSFVSIQEGELTTFYAVENAILIVVKI